MYMSVIHANASHFVSPFLYPRQPLFLYDFVHLFFSHSALFFVFYSALSCNPLSHFQVFLCPLFCTFFFPALFLGAQMLPVSEKSTLLFVRISDKYDDNLILFSFPVSLRFLMFWDAEECGI